MQMSGDLQLLIPGRKPGEKYVVLTHNILSADECKAWIAEFEAKGFQPASLLREALTSQAHGGCKDEKTKNPHRTNDRLLVMDAKKAELLTERLKCTLPETWQHEGHSWKRVGLNERLSVLRYQSQERYGRHVDVPYEDESRGIRSFITCQLYLNEGFVGGETRFDQEVGFTANKFHERGHLDVVPKTGAALLFEHELVHEGCAVVSGIKYTVRIDVMYKKFSETKLLSS